MAGEKIIIADDNTQIRMLVKAALGSGGYALIEAVDGEDALQKALTEQPDLMLLDVTMPKLDGFEVLQFLSRRPEGQNIKVMMLTTAGQQSDVQFGYTLGVIGYMIKPFEPGQLRDAVARALRPVTF
ncbi:MAG TPA: response regulator [Coriobacteriia bacterium]